MQTVRFGSARYSVPTAYVGHQVEVSVGESEVIVTAGEREIARHPLCPPADASILDEHYGGARVRPSRPVRVRKAVEREFLELGPSAEAFLRAAAAAGCRARTLDHHRGLKNEGIAALRQCGEISSAAGLLNPIAFPWRSELAMNLPAEAREEARSLAAAELELARGMDVPRAVGVGLRAVAALERNAAAVDLLREAVALLEGSPGVLELARAQLDLGAALRRLGHRIEARDPLRQALEIATRCGAVPLAERAREESLLAGARPRRPRLRGIDALTAAELRVRPAGRRRTIQPRDRAGSVHHQQNGRGPPGKQLQQAPDHVARRACRRPRSRRRLGARVRKGQRVATSAREAR